LQSIEHVDDLGRINRNTRQVSNREGKLESPDEFVETRVSLDVGELFPQIVPHDASDLVAVRDDLVE
jgi:hypothetical protein